MVSVTIVDLRAAEEREIADRDVEVELRSVEEAASRVARDGDVEHHAAHVVWHGLRIPEREGAPIAVGL